MALDLDETALSLAKPAARQSIYLRAVRLFEFQVSLFYPDAFSAKTETEPQVNARLFAALKLLEYIEAETVAKGGALTLKALAANPHYAQIFDHVILKSGGWRRIRNLPPSTEFDEQIKIRRDEASSVVKLIDFSYRFAILKPKSRAKGGVNMARKIVRKAVFYGYRKQATTLGTRWREYRLSAAFLYLLRVQKFDLFPKRISSTNFAAALLQQADDTDHLKEFFLDYQHLGQVLLTVGYSFPQLNANLGAIPPSLPMDPFSNDIVEEIQKYKSADK